MGQVEAAGEAVEVVEEAVEVVEDDGKEVDRTKVDMEIMEDMVDMEGKEGDISIKFDWSLLCPGFTLIKYNLLPLFKKIF